VAAKPPTTTPKRNGRPRLFNDHQRAAELRRTGLKWAEVAVELNVNKLTLDEHIREIQAIMAAKGWREPKIWHNRWKNRTEREVAA